MWWFLRKKAETDTEIIYTYGFESKEPTGTVSYNKLTEDFKIIKLADKDNLVITERFLFRHLYRVINEENCPNERQIAIG